MTNIPPPFQKLEKGVAISVGELHICLPEAQAGLLPLGRATGPESKKARLRGLFGMLLDLGSGLKTWKWCPEEDSNLHALASAST